MNSEIASALARFFEGSRGPSHDELNRLFKRSGIEQFDPARDEEAGKVGKLKRVRGGLLEASRVDPDASGVFVRELVSLLRARGCFTPGADHYAGEPTITAAQSAFLSVGLRLTSDGELMTAMPLGGLEGSALSQALRAYVRRIQYRSDDSALTVGTAKELMEAAARHLLVEETGSYDVRMAFDATLYKAALQAELGTPTTHMLDDLDEDPARALEQALVLAGIAINRLRNSEGSGHGRPHPTRANRRLGALSALLSSALAQALLPDLLEPSGAQPRAASS